MDRKREAGIRREAFTLVELIVVIAIIAGVAAILLPTFNKAKREVQKVQDVANMKKIAEAWQFFFDEGIRFTNTGYMYNVMQFLAGWQRTPEYCRINDASVYISSGDKYASKPGKGNICKLLDGGSLDYTDNFLVPPSINEMHKSGTSRSANSNIISYGLIAGLPLGAPRDTTPIAFTRGLCADGTWHDKFGLYGDSGGYVMYLDGHVKWFDGKRPAQFLKWDQSGYTTNIRNAIPNTAYVVCCAKDTKTNIVNKNNSLMFTLQMGTGGAE